MDELKSGRKKLESIQERAQPENQPETMRSKLNCLGETNKLKK